MVIIKFGKGNDWFKANWVFRQLAEDTAEAYPRNKRLGRELEKAQAFGRLDLSSLENDDSLMIAKAIREVADDTLCGEIPGWKQSRPADEDGQNMYLDALAELLTLLNNQLGSRNEGA